MSQGAVLFMSFATDVLLICWFGTQLTQHVRDNSFLYSKELTSVMRRSIKKLSHHTCIWQSLLLCTLWPFLMSSLLKN